MQGIGRVQAHAGAKMQTHPELLENRLGLVLLRGPLTHQAIQTETRARHQTSQTRITPRHAAGTHPILCLAAARVLAAACCIGVRNWSSSMASHRIELFKFVLEHAVLHLRCHPSFPVHLAHSPLHPSQGPAAPCSQLPRQRPPTLRLPPSLPPGIPHPFVQPRHKTAIFDIPPSLPPFHRPSVPNLHSAVHFQLCLSLSPWPRPPRGLAIRGGLHPSDSLCEVSSDRWEVEHKEEKERRAQRPSGKWPSKEGGREGGR